jgi:hypothetical protein
VTWARCCIKNFLIRARIGVRQRLQHRREIVQNGIVVIGQEHDDGDFPASKVLLVPDALISSQKCIKSGFFGRGEQFAIA